MKDRYNSENNLKNAFDNYQMPFDDDAFDQFKKELDKDEKQNKVFWWLLYGKRIAPVLILGVIFLSIVYFLDINTKNELTPANTIITNTDQNKTINEGTENEHQDSRNEIANNSKIAANQKNINAANNRQFVKSKVDNNLSSKNVIERIKTSDPKNTNEHRNVDVKTTSTSSSTGAFVATKEALVKQIGKNDSRNDQIHSSDISITNSKEEANTGFTVASLIEDIQLLDNLDMDRIERLHQEKPFTFDGKVTPYVKKFKRYLYFNIGIGLTKEDNFGVSDPFFKINKTNESFWRATLAYQFTSNTSFEFSYIRKNLSLGYNLKDYTYWEKVGSKVNIFKFGMVNKIGSIGPKLNLNFTNGVSMIKATQTFNDFPDFSKTVSSQNIPDNISNINFEWEGLYSSKHFMYSSGLSVDYQLSKRLELNFGAEYTLGFKPIMAADLNYVEGEGVNKKVETHTNGSFASITLGLKYRLRRN